MKASFLIAILVAAGSPALAQPSNNAIFFGGAADGHSAAQNTPLPSANQAGGAGDGGSGGTSGAGIAANQFGGGADGQSFATYEQITVSPLLNNGGSGDGHSIHGNTPVAAVTNGGGAGDGWNLDGKTAPSAVTNGGGTGDGVSTGSKEPLAAVVNQRGGVGDGWTSTSVITTLAPPVPLPQAALSFSAMKQGEVSVLDWQMKNERGVERYIVERSSNAVTFLHIGELLPYESAKGEYKFIDEKPLIGHNYYRVRLLYSKSAEFSPLRLLVFEEALSILSLKLFPNPATTRMTAVLPATWLGSNTVLNVYNSIGTLILQQRITPLVQQEMPLIIESLSPGVYTLQAATDQQSVRSKFVKR